MRAWLFLLGFCLAGELVAEQTKAPLAVERNARNGLPTTAAWIAEGGELRVAFLGGSITAADGWRTLTTRHLQSLRPDSNVREIAAGLPGTGSDLGACRLEPDVLRHSPHLLFVEFAVNDSTSAPDEVERTMEGIVRQARRADPKIDLCFVYTLSTPGLPSVLAGHLPPTAQAMENVAAHYGIPSVHFGFEVARRVSAGELVFKGAAANPERAFSLDGVHPTPTGHELYAKVLRLALPKFLAAGRSQASFPSPLHPDNWENAEQRELTATLFRGAWTQVAPDDPFLIGATKSLLPPMWRTDQAGAAVEFEFTGTRLGLLGLAAPDSGEFIVTVDDLPAVTDTFYDAYVTRTFCRARKWFYPHALAPGRHRVRVELSSRAIDKAAIKDAAGRPHEPGPTDALQRLALGALLLVDTGP